ncbi:serine hydrolase [Ferrimicrobium acidiphilum]|jgi:beta-lactamase class A|uniref:serine hydrolase n=1 Tax=Ferrimicrobium acidiphilum TaxID=121039 RepID=UPI0023F21630|nr:serine hydrolase [Ferrimicrobium acidiphilum]
MRYRDIIDITGSFCDGGPYRSVVVADMRGMLLAAHNPDRLFPPASLAKVLIAETTVHVDLDFSRPVLVSRLHPTRYPSILGAFDQDRELTFGELMALSLATSDNAAADYVLDLTGVDRVNERAQEFGMTSTHIATGFRDDEFSRGDESTTCARDMVRLFEHIYAHKDIGNYRRIWRALINNLRNTRIPGLLPDDLPVAHKTGSLEGIAHDVGVLLIPNMPVLLAVLTANEPVTLETSLEIAYLAREVYDWAVDFNSH